MITPFLALVLAGYAAFVTSLGVVWVRNALGDARAAKR